MSKGKGGRPAHEPTEQSRRQVEAMAGYGVPAEDIGRVLGIDAKTLRKYYREELDTGRVKANSKVAEALYRKATSDGPQSVAAAIFWLKTQAGWRETTHLEHTGKDGAPLQPPVIQFVHDGQD